ncbi:RNA-directed DNA polymerase, eukaryota, reverse transcriptase zinc-binding domain protein [Tanacetum coccineum]|uniref:RNA-directed DNA polymerase, eukaryota, reverse transcriptase zinc-binding domain protein n=1 Tax=Tanacetum coccineum TaxID=301880 RepID=A0ABQ5CTG1_9ASTR
MKRISTSIKSVTPSFKVDERLIWVEISGLPLCAWGSNAFKKVACLFGKFMFFEVEESIAMSSGRVCVSTKSQHLVSENVQVEIHGETFDIQVYEIGTWSINIVDESLDSSAFDDENKPEYSVHNADINVSHSRPSIEECSSDLSRPPGFEHLKRGSPYFSKTSIEECSPDRSRPPGFEHLKKGSPNVSKCSTSFARYRKKDIKGISLIHEMSKLIEVGNSLGIQESKMKRLELFRLKSMWGNYNFDYACSLPRGRSGGLISMWDPNSFVKDDIWCDDAFIIVKGRWKNRIDDCYMVNIYGPHDHMAKNALWNRICDFMPSHSGKYILFGDMNEVREENERLGSIWRSYFME